VQLNYFCQLDVLCVVGHVIWIINHFTDGMGNALYEIVFGLVFAALIAAFVSAGLIPQTYLLIFFLLNGLATAAFLLFLPLSSFAYLIGWLFGMYMMLQGGILEIWDIILYILPPLAVIASKIANLFSS